MAQLDKSSYVNATLGNSKYYDEAGNPLVVLTKAIQYTATVGDQATPVISAVVGKKIRVFSMAIATSINGPIVYLRNGAGGTQLSETIYRAITGSTMPVNYQRTAYYPIWLFETTAGTALVCNCSAVGTCSVQIVYALV